jgi:hypothetical protein
LKNVNKKIQSRLIAHITTPKPLKWLGLIEIHLIGGEIKAAKTLIFLNRRKGK